MDNTTFVNGRNREQFVLRRAVPEDISGIMNVMNTAKVSAPPGWFVDDDEAYVASHLENKGFIVVAQERSGAIAGFMIIHFPGIDAKNLGRHLKLSEEQLLQVVHMDSVAVLPQYRGNHLQKELIAAAEELLESKDIFPPLIQDCSALRALTNLKNFTNITNLKNIRLGTTVPYHYYMCTVHPDNVYSVKNFEDMGYRVVVTTEKYGGLMRHVMMKKVKNES